MDRSIETLNVDTPITAVSPPLPAPSTPTNAALTRPPADPAGFEQWLTTPGGKSITADDLHVIAPQLIGAGGHIKSGLYKGGHVSVSIGDGDINVTVHSPDTVAGALLGDVDVKATLAAKEGHLVAGVHGTASDQLFTKAVQGHLDRFNKKLVQAGMGIDRVEVVKGQIKMQVEPIR